MKCIKCGKEIPDGNNFCIYCGAKQPTNSALSQLGTSKVEKNITEDAFTKPKKSYRKWIWLAVFVCIGIAGILKEEEHEVEPIPTNEITSPTEVQSVQSNNVNTQNLASINQIEEPVMETEVASDIVDEVYEEEVELTEYYKGLIDGKYPITVDLYIDLSHAKGYYYYDKYGPENRLTLDGEWVENDEGGSNLVIKEYNAAGKLIGTFTVEGHSEDMDQLEGTYTLLSKDKKMPFVLNLQK